jgi:hypothetical protein
MLLASSVCGLFKWRQFDPEVILLAVGWYLRFSLSYRDVEELLAGGADALGRKGADSVRISWTDIVALPLEILIVSPCGFGVEEAAEQARQLLQQPTCSRARLIDSSSRTSIAAPSNTSENTA